MMDSHTPKLFHKSQLDHLIIIYVALYVIAIFFIPREFKAINEAVLPEEKFILTKGDEFYLPLRYTAESIGYAVGYDEWHDLVTFNSTYENGYIFLSINLSENIYTKNGETFTILHETFYLNEKIYMLLDDFVKIFSCEYSWYQHSETVVLKNDDRGVVFKTKGI